MNGMNKFPVTDSIIGLSAENGQLESDLSLDNPSDWRLSDVIKICGCSWVCDWLPSNIDNSLRCWAQMAKFLDVNGLITFLFFHCVYCLWIFENAVMNALSASNGG